MIKDFELLTDIKLIVERKIIVWGIGINGKKVLEQLKRVGILMHNIVLCDSDEHKWGKQYDAGVNGRIKCFDWSAWK